MNIPRMKPKAVTDESYVLGGPCFICQKPLIPSLASAPLMSKPIAKASRAEKLQRDLVKKYLNKDINIRTPADLTQINRFLPLDEKAYVVSVSCGHLFHRHCFREYSKNYKQVKKCGMVECPLCRKLLLTGNTVCLDYRSIDCGHDKLPLPYSKEIQAMEKEGVEMRDACLQARLNYSRAFRFYLQQMFKLKYFRREVVEYYTPYWTNLQNVDLVRDRRRMLKREASERLRENLEKAAVFLTRLEDDGLPHDALWTIRKIRRSREGLDSFRSLANVLQKKHTDKVTGELNIPAFKDHIVKILCRGFDFP